MTVVYLYMSEADSIGYRICADNMLVTRLMSGGYYPYVTKPGTIRFSIGGTDAIGMWAIMTPEPGQSRYLQLKIVDVPNPIHRTTRPNLRIVSEEQALKVLPALRLVPGVPTGTKCKEE